MAAMAFFSTTAYANDFNKPGFVVEADGEVFGISLGTGASTDFSDDSRTLEIRANSLPLTLGVIFIDEASATDYRLYANKQFEIPLGQFAAAYFTPEVSYTWGDNFTNTKELRVSPVVGATYAMGMLTTFAEVGYEVRSLQGDHSNFKKADGHSSIGVVIPVNQAKLTLAMVDERNVNFKKTDREVVAKMNFKF